MSRPVTRGARGMCRAPYRSRAVVRRHTRIDSTSSVAMSRRSTWPHVTRICALRNAEADHAAVSISVSFALFAGRAGTMTHDYKRHGTTTLFAALNVLTGVVVGRCLPRHRNTEFLKFLRIIDREVPKGLQIHMICDNYGVHKHPNVKAWLAKTLEVSLALHSPPPRGSIWSNGGFEN